LFQKLIISTFKIQIMNQSFQNTTLTLDDDAVSQLIFIILLGLSVIVAFCLGICVCYGESKRVKIWATWVKNKKLGVPMVQI
jgi:hypothetical protein